MHFLGKLDEYLYVDTISNKNKIDSINNTFSILWVINPDTTFKIDSQYYTIQPFQLVFLTNIQKIESYNDSEFRIIKFNQYFYCLDNHDSEIGYKGALFYGSVKIPIVNISSNLAAMFHSVWDNLQTEIENKSTMQFEMLQIDLKRLLILSMRAFKEANEDEISINKESDMIKNFYYLLELHFKTKRTVKEFADLLYISPKSLTNHFATYHNRTPLKIIHERQIMEAKRLLNYTKKSLKEIAFELGFEDNQSFSRFFKNNVGITPSEFKNKNQEISDLKNL
jgi:AraC family transcriptional activator of pobA